MTITVGIHTRKTTLKKKQREKKRERKCFMEPMTKIREGEKKVQITVATTDKESCRDFFSKCM